MNLISACNLLFLSVFSGAAMSAPLSIKYDQSVVINTKKKFQKSKLGGFSGLVIKENDFYVISDDRGRFGDSRIYKFKFSNQSQKPGTNLFQLIPAEKISLFKKSKTLKVYDLEALAPFQDGWIISSEGDRNTKPKVPPEILFVRNKTIQQKIKVPDDFLPKFNGNQTSGLYNNKAFEGMYYDDLASRLYLVSESGLVQKSDGDLVFYILEYINKDGKFSFDRSSRVDFTEKIEGSSLYNGASEFIKISEGTFLLLTRSVQSALSLQYTNIVWLLKRKSDQGAWEIKDKYIVNTENGKDELNQNYEGMAVLDLNGRKYLVLVSDDNFNSFEKTVFSFFELEVK